MAKTKLIFFIFISVCLCSCGPAYKWSTSPVNGRLTGCVASTADDVHDALGEISSEGSYLSPSGKIYPEGSSTAKVASIVLEVQPKMTSVKKVIAHSEEAMPKERYENRLSNWFVDIIMNKVSALSGKKVDVGICNFGGIRVGMPEGDVMLDDIKSMFPFKNYVVYLELSGRHLRNIFENMAQTKFEAVGGVSLVAENKKLIHAEIGGAPVEDDRMYSVATISFLLYGGDGLYLASDAVNLVPYDVTIDEAVLEHVYNLASRGESIKGSDVTHVVIR